MSEVQEIQSPVTTQPPVTTQSPVTTLAPVNVSPMAVAVSADGAMQPMVVAPREGCCVASAICGLTAIVPVISQLAGLGLGVAGLIRIRRARRRGIYLRGTGWAVTGLCSSGFALMCWVGVFIAFLAVGATFADSAGGLQSALDSMQGINNLP